MTPRQAYEALDAQLREAIFRKSSRGYRSVADLPGWLEGRFANLYHNPEPYQEGHLAVYAYWKEGAQEMGAAAEVPYPGLSEEDTQAVLTLFRRKYPGKVA